MTFKNNKYEATGETITLLGRKLHRIRRLKDGAIGGYIEAEKNLDIFGDAWVSGNAKVFGNAEVSGNAWVSGKAEVFGNAKVFGNAEVFGNAKVFGNAEVSGNAKVFGKAKVSKPCDYIHVVGLRFSVTIRSDGLASIGCQTRRISEWLRFTFEKQTEITDREEFDRTFAILSPLFRLYETPVVLEENTTNEPTLNH